MKQLERRHHQRYPLVGKLRVQELSHLGFPRERERIIQGRIQGISAGGLDLLTRQLLTASSLVRGELLLPKIPIGLPVLLQVRWVQEQSKGHRYRIGLQFLL
jgi:PilZ domain